MFPQQKQFTDFMKLHRIKRSTRVVFYDSKAGMPYFATRAQYVLRAYGHKNVSVLNGGLTKWVAEGRPTESILEKEEDYNYELDNEKVVSYEQIVQLEKDSAEGKNNDTQVLDARGEGVYAQGHISIAKNVFFKKLMNEDNTIKSKDQVKAIFEENGVDFSKKIICSCGSGISGTYLIAALDSVDVVSNVALYDGSWSEYSVR